jgi:TusA-related sulfurtransferase
MLNVTIVFNYSEDRRTCGKVVVDMIGGYSSVEHICQEIFNELRSVATGTHLQIYIKCPPFIHDFNRGCKSSNSSRFLRAQKNKWAKQKCKSITGLRSRLQILRKLFGLMRSK